MPLSLSHVLVDLQNGINSSKNLLSKIQDFGIPRIQLEIIVEMAFLRIFVAWESFLEESFIRYAVGAASPSGYTPNVLTRAQNIGHALELVSSGRDYGAWNSASEVTRRSALYFQDGEPYRSALEPASIELNEMNTIRNRITHKSMNSKSKFNAFVRRKFGHGVRGMTPGRFLMTSLPNPPPDTFLDYYIEVIKIASSMIVP
jgi:hypothetical protein